jgi:hypothetical protein
MDYYKHKYLKYKNKYINLRMGSELIGSAVCHYSALHQHTGECWSDSLQSMLIYSDTFNDKIQEILIKLSTDEKISEYVINVIKKKQNDGLPLNYDVSNTADYDHFLLHSTNLIKFYRDRFLNRIELDSTSLNMERPIRLISNPSFTLACERFSLSLIRYKRHIKTDSSIKGARKFEQIYMLKLFNYLFLDNDVMISYSRKYLNYDKVKLNEIELSKVNSILISTTNHAMSVITCGGEQYFFNDNLRPTMHKYDWKSNFTKNDLNELYLAINSKLTFDKRESNNDKIMVLTLIQEKNITEINDEDENNEIEFNNIMLIYHDLDIETPRIKPFIDKFIFILKNNTDKIYSKLIGTKYPGSIILFLAITNQKLFSYCLENELCNINNLVFDPKYSNSKTTVFENLLLYKSSRSYGYINYLVKYGAKLYESKSNPTIFLMAQYDYEPELFDKILSINETVDTIFLQNTKKQILLEYIIILNKPITILNVVINHMLKYIDIIKVPTIKYYSLILQSFITSIMLNKIDVLELLFDKFNFININAVVDSKNFLIYSILKNSNIDTIKYLITKGININYKDDTNHSALDYAIKKKMSYAIKNKMSEEIILLLTPK